MELIDSEQRARRLARTVAADIVLYNEKRLKAGVDLSLEIEEGRSHFCARVAPSLHWIFEEVLDTTALRKPAQANETAAVPAPVPVPVKPAPVKPAPVKPAPVKAAPVKLVPVKPAPVEPPPVKPAPVKPAPVEPAPVRPAPVRPAPVKPAPVKPAPVEPAPVESAPIEAPAAGVAASAAPSEPAAKVEPGHLESELLPASSRPTPATIESPIDSELASEDSHARPQRIERSEPPREPTTNAAPNRPFPILLVALVIVVAIALGWLLTR